MKRAFILLSVLMLSFCLTVTALASGDTRTGNVIGGGSADTPAATPYTSPGSGDSGVALSDPGATQDFINGELFGERGMIHTNVTSDTIVDKLEAKGNEIVFMLQTVGKFVCIAGFIVCCILTIFGAIGSNRLLAGAIMGMLISGFAYAGIACGREIVNWIAAWAIS